ncbi:MMPL family transporter [Rhodococcus sp. OK302]|uniref:MMPL family transporter n=1 Tax=Rhodococcus sp. OK302 TaxID=1882769 RepID=UPI000B9415C4|nr:MMPL family transporter [Rhodococcus sp. OK302]OYD68927.1 RND superfamily putative drug exporter [Rhodococcus sp. OK302]
MATYLYRLGKFSFRHKYLVVAAWILVIAVIGGTVAATQPTFSKEFNLPGTDSQRATGLMNENFAAASKQQSQATTSILVAADDGLAAHSEQIDKLVAQAKTLPDVVNPELVVNPVTVAAADPSVASFVLGDNGHVGLIQLKQSIKIEDQTQANKTAFLALLEEFRTGGLQVEGTGSMMQVQAAGGLSEMLGFAVAFIVMIIAFGALIAAFIPLVTAIVGISLAILTVTLGAGVFDINQGVIAIVSMIGIAVSIDYALFIVSRYRSELNLGGSREAAVGRAVGTAGTSVVFAGLTVVIAMAALTVVGVPLITQMGLSAAVAVIIAVLGAITLIPAILAIFGRIAFSPRIPGVRHGDEPASLESNGHRWVKFVTKYPWPIALISLLILVIAALPMTKMELGLSFTQDEERPALSLLQRGFGEGVNGQLFVVLHAPAGTDIAPIADETVTHIKGLANVATPDVLMWQGNGTNPSNPNVGANSALIAVTPKMSPSGPETHELMNQIRDYQSTVSASGAELGVAGQTAIVADMSSKLSSALVPYLIVVVGLAFIVLMLVFRSLLVPLTATLGFLFSICATFGATVAIFQEGAFGLIQNTAPIISFLPIFMIGVVFGLAMDYQVFLVTRMREEYVHGHSAKEAIISGYTHGARVVASAAIIMISVFGAFMLSSETASKMMGFGLAAAVFFDAFIIRMIVIPAVMSILGDSAWKLPAWLDKILPNVDIEGEAIRLIPIEEDPDEDLVPVRV